MITPQALRAVSHAEVPATHVDVKADMTWWQKILAGIAAMVATTVCGAIGSHFGGVTNAQLDTKLQAQETRIGDRIDKAILTAKKDSDDMKRYVDEKTAAKVVAKKPKKPKPSEQTETGSHD